MNSRAWIVTAIAGVFCATSDGQDISRDFCTGEGCIPDTLELAFDNGAATLEIPEAGFTPGMQVHAQIVTDTQTAEVQGWSYAVKHDAAFLTVVADSVTTAGTIVDPDHPDTVAIEPRFEISRPVDGGIISAVVLSLIGDTELPVGRRNAICNVTYTLDASPGADGTTIAFASNEIGVPNSPPTEINFTVGGASRQPASVVDGVVRVAGGEACTAPDWAFYFGGEVAEGELDLTGAASAAISMRNLTPSAAFQFGASFRDGVHAFSSALGDAADRLIISVISNDMGRSEDAAAPNTARGPQVTGVSRGAAIAAFEPGDFFAVDLDPEVGGPGFTVGYVTDIQVGENRLAALGSGGPLPCAVHEILQLSFEAPQGAPFVRGDADGSGKHNVTDAVLIILVTLGRVPERFDCDDALDSNDDGAANISDAIPVLMYLFQGGNPLPAPFLACEHDPTPDELACAAYSSPLCAVP